jgi:hypothetical protein
MTRSLHPEVLAAIELHRHRELLSRPAYDSQMRAIGHFAA